MKIETRNKKENQVFVIGNIKLLGTDIIISRIIGKNKFHQEVFLVSVDKDGVVKYAIQGKESEYELLEDGNVIGYYRNVPATEEIDNDRRMKPSLRRDLNGYLEECGFIKKLQ